MLRIISKKIYKSLSKEEAKEIGEKIGIKWDSSKFSLDEFWAGIKVELEHGSHDPETNVTNSDAIMTGKITWAHLKEMPDYYTKLKKMES